MFNFKFILPILFSWSVQAQELESFSPPVETEAEPEVFQPVLEPGLARAIIEFPVYSFYLGAPDINGVAYVPNFSPRLGFHASWKDMGLTYTSALPLPKEEIDRRGNSDQMNVVLNRYWRGYGLDIYYQQYRGFYVASPFTELNIKKPDRYPQLPDAEVQNYGFNFYQVLNPKRYSMGASFSQSEIQLLGGGSWIFTGFYNFLKMERGNVFVPGSDPNSMQTRPDLESGTFHTYGAGIGYGHTWLRNRAFITMQGISGLGAQTQKIDELEGGTQGRVSAALKVNANLAIGYAPKNYVLGGKLLADALVSSVRNTQVYSTLLNGQIYFGARF